MAGDSSDWGIVLNVVFSVTVAAVLYGVYAVLWYTMRDYCAPNTRYAQQKREATGRAAAGDAPAEETLTSELRNMNDADLLAWIGLDAFVFLQTLRLLAAVMIMLAVPGLLVIVPVYMYAKDAVSTGSIERAGSQAASRLFMRATIEGVGRHALWVTLMFNVYALCVVLYAIYVFYRSLTVYRQAHHRSPSACMAQVTLRRLAHAVGGVTRARRLVDMTSRAVVLANVSAKYTPARMTAYLSALGLEDVGALVVVRHRPVLRALLARRNAALEDVERALVVLHDALAHALATERGTDVGTLLASVAGQRRMSPEARADVVSRAMLPTFARDLRPKAVVSRPAPAGRRRSVVRVDALEHAYCRMLAYDARLDAAVAASARGDEYSWGASSESSESPDSPPGDECRARGDALVSGRTIVSARALADVAGNVRDYGLTLFGSSVPVIVVFGSRRSATVATQTLLSGRPFAMDASPAPAPEDVLWANMYLPAMERRVRWLVGTVAYACANVAFTLVAAAIVAAIDVGALLSRPAGRASADDGWAVPLLAGVVSPLTFTLLLALSRLLIDALARYEGHVSETRVQMAVLQMYTWLLCVQTFSAHLLNLASDAVLSKLLHGGVRSLAVALRASLPRGAAFFFNLVVQRATISLALALVDPLALAVRVLSARGAHRDYRAVARAALPRPVAMGVAYPEHVLLVFLTTLALAPIAPVIAVAGAAYALAAHRVLRRAFVFASEPLQEGGGLYWTFMPTPILAGCAAGQLFSLVHFALASALVPAVLTLALMAATAASVLFVRRVFGRLAVHAPLGDEGLSRAKALVEAMHARQAETLRRVAVLAGDDAHLYDDPACSPLSRGPLEDTLGADAPGPTSSSRAEALKRGPLAVRHDSQLDLAYGSDAVVGECRYDTVPFDFAGRPPSCEDALAGDVCGIFSSSVDIGPAVRSTASVGDQPGNTAGQSEAVRSDEEGGRDPNGHSAPTQRCTPTLLPADNPYCNPVLFERHLTVHVPPTLVPLVLLYSRE